MKTIQLKGSSILIGESVAYLERYLPKGKRVIIITDTKVGELYKDLMVGYSSIQIPVSEKCKTMDTIAFIAEELLKLGADRSTFLVAFGGGIVCDITGFISSIYMRGIEFGFVSTTLLSQVDASVGGKNGVNFMGYKNILGVFAQPKFVICDMSFFRTLNKREYRAGFSEIVKVAVIKDPDFFRFIERNVESLLMMEKGNLEYVISRAIEIKGDIVEQDEREKGIRKFLNLGHTFGHAIEKESSEYIHGEAVSMGMVLAGRVALGLGILQRSELYRLIELLTEFELPVKYKFEVEKMGEYMFKDKKKEKESLTLILPRSMGRVVEKVLSKGELMELLKDIEQ